MKIGLRALLCVCALHSSFVFALSGTSAAKGSLSPVEKVNADDMAELRSAKIAELVRQRQYFKALSTSVTGASASPVLTGLGQLRPRNKLAAMQHPKLTSLGSVTDYVAGLSLLPETTKAIALHASVNVLTPLSQFDLISTLAIDVRVAELAPLQDYSLWNQVVAENKVDTQYSSLQSATPRLFVDRRADILTPLANFGFADEQEAIAYTNLADTGSAFSRPKLYLRDYNAKLRTQVFYDDNIFSSSTNTVGSVVVNNDLTGSVALERGRASLNLSYVLSDGRFLSSSDDNFTDGQFSFVLSQRFGKTQSVSFTADQETVNQARGSGLLEGENADAVNEPLQSKQNRAILSHNYGENKGKLRTTSSLSYNSLDYSTLPELTREREYKQLTFNNTTKYRLGAKTLLSLGSSFSEIDYQFDPEEEAGVLDSLDSTTRSFLLGVEREVGRSSLARVGFGAIDRSFTDADRESRSSPYWDAEFVWKPRSYSSISLNLGRRFIETNGVGDFIDSREHKIAWAHAWAKRLTTQVNAQYTDDTYIGDDRQDQRIDLGFRVSYKFSERLSLIGGGRYQELLSEGSDLDFKRKVVFIESNFRL